MHQIKREQLSRKGLIFQALKVTNAVNRDDGKVSAGAINIDQDYSIQGDAKMRQQQKWNNIGPKLYARERRH